LNRENIFNHKGTNMLTGPTPEYLEACRIVVGDDNPRTVLTLIQEGSPQMDEVRRVDADIIGAKIEALAVQIAEPDFVISHGSIDPLIGHVGEIDQRAVLKRAAEIARASGEAMHAEADSLTRLDRLAHAAGMPAGENPIMWLRARGLVEEAEGGGWRFKPAKPESVT
jgi:hypothetical protein